MGDGTKRDLLPREFSARTQLLEYGGCPYLLCDELLVFVNAQDQNLYGLAWTQPSAVPVAISGGIGRRYGDLTWDRRRGCVLAVMEQEQPAHQEPVLSLVVVRLQSTISEPEGLLSGADFYAWPCLSPNGEYLAWISWNHPAMPWDNTQLWVAPLDDDGQIGAPILVAGGADESIAQPQFSPEGDLYWVSDRDNWWNIYRLSQSNLFASQGRVEAITQLEAECAAPRWVSGMSCFGFMAASTICFCYSQHGEWRLATVDVVSKHYQIIETDLNYFADVYAAPTRVLVLGANASHATAIYALEPQILRRVTPAVPQWSQEYFSQPRGFYFPSGQQSQVHSFYYPPHNPDVVAPASSLPPLIVLCHGGPTGATHTALNLKIQFWTSRGFAVLDVNYRGSTGFGRAYRQSLQGQWGMAEVEDLCCAADYVTAQGWVNPRQRFIKGGSAGGYSVLAALCFHSTFNAGVSLYGIGDLTALAADTHKFEARYLDSLIGPYPESADVYSARSPANFAGQISCPLLVFQGLLDKVVPPNQARQMVDAVRAAGNSVTYVEFADEGHGFRQAANIIAQLDAELDFYQGLLRHGH